MDPSASFHADTTGPRFAMAHARGEAGQPDWGRLAFDCVEQLGPIAAQATLGFIYVTDALAGDLPAIIAFLKRTTSIADWVGSVGIGIVAGASEYFDQPAIAVLAAALPPDAHCLITGEGPGAGRDWARRVGPALGVVHADPRAPQLVEKVEALARDLSTFLVGGLASSRGAMDQVAGRVVHGGVSGVMLAPERRRRCRAEPGLLADRAGAHGHRRAAERDLRARRPPGARRLQGRHRRGAGAQAGPCRRLHPCRLPGRRIGYRRLRRAQPDRHRSAARLDRDRRRGDGRRLADLRAARSRCGRARPRAHADLV